MKRTMIIALLSTLIMSPGYALDVGPNDVFVRVIDCGEALSCVVKMPGNQYMVFDGGLKGLPTLKKIEEVIPPGGTLNLLVVSHAHDDHVGAIPGICRVYTVERVLRKGARRPSRASRAANAAIRREVLTQGCIDMDLQQIENIDGAFFRYGEASVEVLSGYGILPNQWLAEVADAREKENAGSIVVRLAYKGRSVLFTGDAVGRHDGQTEDVSILTEKHLIDSSAEFPNRSIQSDVIIAPHHGGDQGSSTPLIKAVSPQFVVFPAGHSRILQFPRATAAHRYENAGIRVRNIFRTDLGDNDGPLEWSFGATARRDRIGDDDVDIVLRANGAVAVQYRSAADQARQNALVASGAR